MKPFDPKSVCEKCGHDQAGTTYSLRPPVSFVDAAQAEPGDRLVRACLRCGFMWNEACLDPLAQKTLSSDKVNWKKLWGDLEREGWVNGKGQVVSAENGLDWRLRLEALVEGQLVEGALQKRQIPVPKPSMVKE